MVGAVIDGSSAITFSRLALATFNLMKTRLSASSAPRISIPSWRILACFQGSVHAAGLATSTGFETSNSSTMRSPLARSEEPVSVTSMAASMIPSATLVSVAPHEKSTSALTLRSRRIRVTNCTSSVAIRLPWRSSSRLTGESSRTHQRGLGVNEALDLTERHVVLDDPVAAGDARVERAVGDVAGHLLRAQDAATERGIVGGRNIGARADRDTPSGFAHQLERLLLEAALGDAEFQDLIRHVVFSRWRSTRRLLDGMAGAGLGLMPVAGAVFGGIDFALLDDFPCARVELAEKARLVAQVAGGAVAALLDGDYQRVGVA